jgi:hypothetical protein
LQGRRKSINNLSASGKIVDTFSFMKKNQTLGTQFKAEDREGLLEQIYASSSRHGFALSEAAWQAIEQQATAEELRCLALLALIPEHEIDFWHWRNHLLESPDLWPVLCEAHAGT